MSAMNARMERRKFLRMVGATALTYPFLRGAPSYAAGGADPIYFVLLFTSCGCVRPKWGAQCPAPTGMTATTQSPLVFRDTLSAFTKAGTAGADLTKYVTVLDGLSVTAAGKGSHEAGMAGLWTATTVSGSNAPTGPSIDQAIAPLIKSQLGVNTPYPNVPLMAQSSADYQQRQVDTRMLYDASANWVDPYTDPSMALAALFPSAAQATTPSASKGPDKTSFIRQQVATQLNADLTALQSRLCTEDRAQIQNLQALWNQNLMQIQNAAMAAASCSPPQLASGVTAGSDPFPIYAQSMANILAMTLACDLTRVASLQYSHALSPVTHTWLGSSQTQTHHSFSHQGPSYIGALAPDPYDPPANPSYQPYPQQLVDIDAWYAKQVAALAYTLSQFKTTTGKNLLDQTVICWGSELDMGAAHNHDDTPFVLIGGGGGKLKTNQVVRFPVNLQNQATMNVVERPHNDLLLTLAQVVGVNIGSAFGNVTTGAQGAIKEILA
jgi:hypothetical protein